ncbi:MAG: carbon-nitrogen hydrolase family protein [Clostridia bacterium]|nr:carbon-nitrogen hydrolase family protein [Clostridia bacterium]
MKLALCQLRVSDNKSDNINRAYLMLKKAAAEGADMAILPEMFCISYRRFLFADASEEIPGGEAYKMLSSASSEFSMTVIGGSIPERAGGKLYNSSMVFSKHGELLGVYRKAHLFDVDFEGYSFRESDVISCGNDLPLIIDEPVRTAIEICFDIRFPEWSRKTMEKGADLLALPAAFSVKTGKAHWELLLRARALDNQMFVAGVAPASSDFSYGHSMLAGPGGEVLCDLGEDENLCVTELPMDELYTMRNSIPIRTAMRKDLYKS